jgi:hypothetical protein
MTTINTHIQTTCAALDVFVASGIAGEARAQTHPSKPDTSPDDRRRIPMKNMILAAFAVCRSELVGRRCAARECRRVPQW